MKKQFPVEAEQKLDRSLPHLQGVREFAAVPSRGWLRAVREAKGMSQTAAAAKADIKQQAFAQFETRELKGTITLESIAYAADALDCEVVYFLLPKAKGEVSFGGSRVGQPGVRPAPSRVKTETAFPKDRDRDRDDLPMELR